jgi:hypothetical protein
LIGLLRPEFVFLSTIHHLFFALLHFRSGIFLLAKKDASLDPRKS